jgi:hypothetical protein
VIKEILEIKGRKDLLDPQEKQDQPDLLALLVLKE